MENPCRWFRIALLVIRMASQAVSLFGDRNAFRYAFLITAFGNILTLCVIAIRGSKKVFT